MYTHYFGITSGILSTLEVRIAFGPVACRAASADGPNYVWSATARRSPVPAPHASIHTLQLTGMHMKLKAFEVGTTSGRANLTPRYIVSNSSITPINLEPQLSSLLPPQNFPESCLWIFRLKPPLSYVGYTPGIAGSNPSNWIPGTGVHCHRAQYYPPPVHPPATNRD